MLVVLPPGATTERPYLSATTAMWCGYATLGHATAHNAMNLTRGITNRWRASRGSAPVTRFTRAMRNNQRDGWHQGMRVAVPTGARFSVWDGSSLVAERTVALSALTSTLALFSWTLTDAERARLRHPFTAVTVVGEWLGTDAVPEGVWDALSLEVVGLGPALSAATLSVRLALPAGGGVTAAATAAVATAVALTPSVIVGAVTATTVVAVAAAMALAPTPAMGAVTGTGSPAVATAVALDPTATVGGATAPAAPAVATAVALAPTLTMGDVTAEGAPAVATAVAAAPTPAMGAVTGTGSPAVATAVALDPTATVGGATASAAPAVATAVAVAPTLSMGGVSPTAGAAVASVVALGPSILLGAVTCTPLPAIAAAVALDVTTFGTTHRYSRAQLTAVARTTARLTSVLAPLPSPVGLTAVARAVPLVVTVRPRMPRVSSTTLY